MSAMPFRAAALAAGLLMATAAQGPLNAQAAGDGNDAGAAASITERVDRAFAAARSGNLAPSTALQHVGPAIIPAIVPYLADDNEDVRRQVVTLLGLTGSASAAPHLASALSDRSDDVAGRAAAALYRMGSDAVRDPRVGTTLRTFVQKSDDAAGAILLLGYVGDAASAEVLATLRQRKAAQSTSVFHWIAPVPVPLAADVALTRLGDGAAKARLLATIRGGDFDALSFLLYALRDIDDRDVLMTLADATLEDGRPAQGGVPSHADIGLRLADVAAGQFVKRFDLSVGGVGTGPERRLSEAELGAVHDAIANRLPN